MLVHVLRLGASLFLLRLPVTQPRLDLIDEPEIFVKFHRALPAAMYAILDRKSTRLNSSHSQISYAVLCLNKEGKQTKIRCLFCGTSPGPYRARRPCEYCLPSRITLSPFRRCSFGSYS